MKSIRISRSTLTLLLAIALLAVTLSAVSTAAPAQADAPSPGSLRGSLETRTFLTSKVYTGSTAVTYTASPLLSRGVDVSKNNFYYAAEAFITADVDSGAAVTVTPQVSADAVNWAALPYTATLSADGTSLLQFPTAGEYLRFSVTHTGTLTVTLKTTFKNTGGQ